MLPRRAWLVPVGAALILLAVGARARAAELSPVPCWQVKALVAHHGGDRAKARQAARLRGYSETEISRAERVCLR